MFEPLLLSQASKTIFIRALWKKVTKMLPNILAKIENLAKKITIDNLMHRTIVYS